MRQSELLARKIAQITRRLADEYGNTDAQQLVYGVYLNRLNIDATEVLRHPINASTCDCINEAIDEVGLDRVIAEYASEGKDPAVYFYEDFLRAYNPDGARARGVHYSPPEVVSYIVRGVNSILEERFGSNLDDAFVLDPCCGTGTFLRYIEQHTEYHPGILGLELIETPYRIASCLLGNSEIRQADGLEDIEPDIGDRPLVVIGNPPYSGHSSNVGKLSNLMLDYRTGLNERNPKWLQDDYVKFIRMAQYRIEKAGHGIVAFITNHSFLFNPTFKIMRENLMNSFNDIYILDLHGNSKKLDGDENIFRIQMGVAISFFIKTDIGSRIVRYASLKGSREMKLQRLRELTLENTPWMEVNTEKPFFLFTPQNSKLRDEYYGFASLFDLFRKSSVGFVTSRDSFALDTDRNRLLERMNALRDGSLSSMDKSSAGDLDIYTVRRELENDPDWRDKIVEVLYRPFDTRWTYYSPALMERPRLPFMENLLRDNIALAIGRAGQVTGSREWDVVFCTDRPADLNLFRRGGAMLFPKWLYINGNKSSNIIYKKSDMLFSYIYALLFSGIYRKRYAEFLGVDYPRIPVDIDEQLMEQLAKLGSELIDIHLQKRFGVESPTRPSSLLPSGERGSNSSLHIGGYELPGKYVKDRKGRELTADELAHIKDIKSTIERTIEIRYQIDQIIRQNPPWDEKE